MAQMSMREEKVHRRDVLDDYIGEDLVGNVYENTKYGYRLGVREYHVNENEDKLVLMCEHLGSNGSETLLLDDILGSRWEHVHGETEYVHQ